jgi:hypothetical protein
MGGRFRDNLDLLIGRHPADYAEATYEARRAIVAKEEGRDPKGLVPSDDPTLAMLLAKYDAEKPRQDRWQIGRIVATTITGRKSGDWRVASRLLAHPKAVELLECRRDCQRLHVNHNLLMVAPPLEKFVKLMSRYVVDVSMDRRRRNERDVALHAVHLCVWRQWARHMLVRVGDAVGLVDARVFVCRAPRPHIAKLRAPRSLNPTCTPTR